MGGHLLNVPPDRIHDIDLSIEEAMKAIMTTRIAIAVNTTLHLYYLQQLLTLSFPLRKIRWSVVSSLIMGTAVYAVYMTINVTGLPTLIAIVGFGAVFYGLVLLLYSPLRVQIWTMTKSLLASREP
jgi:hypothetical protein